MTIRNRSRSKRTLQVYSYLEWGLGQAPDWHREFHKSFVETSYDPAVNGILATKRLWEVPTDRGHWNTDWPYVAFHTASRKPTSYDADKETFLGRYGGQALPAGVLKQRLARRTGNGLDPCASLHHAVTLAPGKEATIIYTLGCADSADAVAGHTSRYRTADDVDTALQAVSAQWNGLLGTVRVDTPDPAMNLMENIWLKYQAISGRMWGRTAYYQTGGAFGFRDQLQDSQLWLHIDPDRTAQQLLLHARHQFLDGTVYHWWHPLSETGLRNNISDNLLWMPYVAHAYLQETGDLTLFDRREPFLDSTAPTSFYDHCVRAIDRALERFSGRGLPLIGEGDWNDGLSAVGLDKRGESIWLGQFLHRILVDFAGIAEERADYGRAAHYQSRAGTLSEKLNTLGWDGEYYFGATKDSGERLGSQANTQGRVWLNPQTWSIIGGIANTARSKQVLDVIEQRLESEIGPLLLTPAYSEPDRNIGYLTRYAPGVRENGGVYTHAATWAVMAAAMVGRNETAYRFYAKLNPINRGRTPDRYCAEPYVTPGNIEGPESLFFGRGGWTWYSGSAAWLYKVGLEWILGIRSTRGGLLIDPCIPSSWPGYSVLRTFRGASYAITVRNPDRTGCGVASVMVDGRDISAGSDPRGCVLPLFPGGSSHEVVVVLGKRT